MNPVTNFEKWINSIATGTAPDIPPVTRFEHFLNKIRLAIARKSDITSGLPAVTAEDNDKVLTVVNGEWDKAAPSGGGEIPMIHIAWDETNNNYVTIETGNEIYEMFSPEGVYGGVVAEVTSYKTIETVSKSEIAVEIGYMEGPEILHIITAEKDSNDPVIVD